jgi:hypothetical protein
LFKPVLFFDSSGALGAINFSVKSRDKITQWVGRTLSNNLMKKLSPSYETDCIQNSVTASIIGMRTSKEFPDDTDMASV